MSSAHLLGDLIGDGMVGVGSDELQRAVVQQSCNKWALAWGWDGWSSE